MKIIDDVITRFLKTEKIRWVDISQVKVDKEFKSIFPQKEADVQKIAGCKFHSLRATCTVV